MPFTKNILYDRPLTKGEWAYLEPRENPGIELKNKIPGIFGLGLISTYTGSATNKARNEMSRLAAVNIIEFYKQNHMI